MSSRIEPGEVHNVRITRINRHWWLAESFGEDGRLLGRGESRQRMTSYVEATWRHEHGPESDRRELPRDLKATSLFAWSFVGVGIGMVAVVSVSWGLVLLLFGAMLVAITDNQISRSGYKALSSPQTSAEVTLMFFLLWIVAILAAVFP